jgi:hypothetical protein
MIMSDRQEKPADKSSFTPEGDGRNRVTPRQVTGEIKID